MSSRKRGRPQLKEPEDENASTSSGDEDARTVGMPPGHRKRRNKAARAPRSANREDETKQTSDSDAGEEQQEEEEEEDEGEQEANTTARRGQFTVEQDLWRTTMHFLALRAGLGGKLLEAKRLLPNTKQRNSIAYCATTLTGLEDELLGAAGNRREVAAREPQWWLLNELFEAFLVALTHLWQCNPALHKEIRQAVHALPMPCPRLEAWLRPSAGS